MQGIGTGGIPFYPTGDSKLLTSRYPAPATTGVAVWNLSFLQRTGPIPVSGIMPKRRETAEEIAARLCAPLPAKAMPTEKDCLSTGCTLLNLAFSGRSSYGVPKGTYLYIIGDSGALKTWSTFCLFAEAARNPAFSKYRFVHDNAENGALMDVAKYFGQAALDRLEPPRLHKKLPVYSQTAKDFYIHLSLNIKKGPCIYVLDSMDALRDEVEEEIFEAEVNKYVTGEGKVAGSFGVGKAKTNSKHINTVVQSLRDNGSILVIISQTRDKINSPIPGMKTRGGGRALRFYAHLEVWTSVRGPITRRYHGKEREVGSTIKIDVQKNRLSGWEGAIEVPFLKGYGIDDVGGCIDYLIEERHWEKIREKTDDDKESRKDRDNPTIHAPEFRFKGRKEELVAQLQDQGEEVELQRLTGKVWNEILEQARPDRKPRYT